MLDFHTHVLPKMDDGSRSVEMSLEMLKKEASLGIRSLIATPHFYATDGSPARFLARRDASWSALSPHLTDTHPRVYLGAEVHYFEGITAVSEILDLRIADTPLLLIEMPMMEWTRRMTDDIRELQNRRDVQVVLAHIDRYRHLVKKEVLSELLYEGVFMQVNTSFFADFWCRREARKMLSAGQIHFVGSDMHNLTDRAPNWDKIKAPIISEITEVTGHNASRYFT